MKLLDGSSVNITMFRFCWAWYDRVWPTLDGYTEPKIISELKEVADYNDDSLDMTVAQWVEDLVQENDRINDNWVAEWVEGNEAALYLEAARRAEKTFRQRKSDRKS